MKTIRILFYIILNILISAGAVWLVFSYLNTGSTSQIDQVETGEGFVDDVAAATVIPDKLIIDSVVSAGNIEYERVVINHIGGENISLSGWKLMDSDGNEYVFPPIELFSGSSLVVNSRDGKDTVTELYWAMVEPVWEAGETVYLTDPGGYPQAMYIIP
jgi:hypothetical protein